jgi:hypothetical protein
VIWFRPGVRSLPHVTSLDGGCVSVFIGVILASAFSAILV